MRQIGMKQIVPLLGVSVLAVTMIAVGGDRTRQDRKDRRSSLVQRRAESGHTDRNRQDSQRKQRKRADDRRRSGNSSHFRRHRSGPPPLFPHEFRTVDGSGNNQSNPNWGASGVPFRRLTPVTYENGLHTPAGDDRPNVRAISNALCNQTESLINSADASAFLWQWGQFLDHDITETPVGSPVEEFDIAIPIGDAWFDPFASGDASMPLDRSAYVVIDNVRQQINNITAYIDASMVYGADESRAVELRTLDGTGRLKTSAGDLLPFNVNGLPNAPTSHDPSFMLAGDFRANEQVGLTAMHTLFVREHNYWADQIAQQNDDFTDEDIYQWAKAIVNAEIQVITYREFLPLLLGADALPAYAGYDDSIDAGIANIFATAAYRVGHTMLSSPMLRLDADLQEVPAGHLELAHAFFNPSHIITEGIDSTLRGLAMQKSQEIDGGLVNDARNMLFGPPGAGGFDLAALNIQRGRDHGLATYNQVRVAYGLEAVESFEAYSPDPLVRQGMAATYGDINQIDAWVGMLCEPHTDGAMVGDTIRAVLVDQFTRLRDGDRFWYQAYLPAAMVAEVEQQTLASIIERNTNVAFAEGQNAFIAPDLCPGDVTGDDVVNIKDLLAVLADWGSCEDCPTDTNADGVVNVTDLLNVFAAWGPCS